MQKQFSVTKEGTDFKKLKLWCGRTTHDPVQKAWCIPGSEAGAPESHVGCFDFLSRTLHSDRFHSQDCIYFLYCDNSMSCLSICSKFATHTYHCSWHSPFSCLILPFLWSLESQLLQTEENMEVISDSPLSLLLSLSTRRKWYLLRLFLFKYIFFHYYSYSNIVLTHQDLSTTTACFAKGVSPQSLSWLKPISGTPIVNMLACPYTGLPVYLSGLNTIYGPFTWVTAIFQLLKHTMLSRVSEIPHTCSLILKYNFTPFFSRLFLTYPSHLS